MGSTIIVDKIEGRSQKNLVEVPVGKGNNVFLHNLYDKSYGVDNIITPTDIIPKGPIVDARVYGEQKNSATIASAITAINSMDPNTRTLLIAPGVWSITGSLTIPSNICVYFLRGAMFDVTGSVTFNGPIIAGNYQIFTGTGTVTISTATPLTYKAWTGSSSNYVEFKTFPRGPGGTPTNSTELVDKNYVDTVVGAFSSFPVGAIVDFAGSTAPDGWLLCDGSQVSRTTYSALFNVIGTTYGAGDGSTTFNVPDCRNRVTAGKGSDSNFNALGKYGGATSYTFEFRAGLWNLLLGAGPLVGTLNYAAPGFMTVPLLQPYITVNKIIKY